MRDFNKILQQKEVRASLGAKLAAIFERNKKLRQYKETEWLQSVRQIKGIYDPGVILDKDQSSVYPKMTRKYCRMVLSRLHEMLFPEGDRNWDMEPTPEPKMARVVVNNIASALLKQREAEYMQIAQQAQQQQGDIESIPKPKVTLEELELAINEWCKVANKKMRTVIDDQMIETAYTEEAKKVLRSGVDYGTGILKGPLVEKRKIRSWKQNDDNGEWDEFYRDKELPLLSNVRIWDWYPDMSVTELKQSNGNYERHVKNKKDLNALAKLPGFDKEYIMDYVQRAPNGDAKYETWELELQTIDAAANAAARGETYKSPSGDTATGGNNLQPEKRYELFEYWGIIDSTDLAEVGVQLEEDEENIVLEVNVWGLGKNAIKVGVIDGASDIYKIFYFEKDETSIYGDGLPRIMRHSQEAISAAARMILDNGAVVAGPQMEINHSLLMPGQNITKFHARKLWWREGRGVDTQYPAIRPILFDSHINELKIIMDIFRQMADEETCLPTWMISSPSSTNETAQGSSLRFGMLSVAVKDIVRNFDVFTESVINAVYQWNMEFNDRNDIKGDFSVKAKGISSLVGKEMRMQAMSQLRSVLQPEDWDYIPRREFLQEIVKIHDLPLTVRTEQEAQEYRQSHIDQEAVELEKEQMRAEIDYRNAQALNMTAGAKQKNAKAESDIADDKTADNELKQSHAMLNRTKANMMPIEAATKMMAAKGKNDGQNRSNKNSSRK